MNQQSNPSFNTLTMMNLRVKVVDVGANPIDGTPPYAALLQAGNASVVGFEPNPQALAKLNEMKGPHESYLPWAVGDGGRHTLHVCQAPGMTSLLPPNPDVLNLFHGFPEWGRILATEEVETVRLDDIPETEGAELIKLDIQGGELMALRHAPTRLADALAIQSEVEFLPMYVGQPLFSEVDAFLRQRGFMFHRFFSQNSRVIRPMLLNNDIYAGMSQLLWADAIFVRDLTRLDLLLDRQLLSMATILHDCYLSIDLVLYLLAEHDRRTGTQLGTLYLSGLQRWTAVGRIQPETASSQNLQWDEP
jgi:FkbM family methyltransferase